MARRRKKGKGKLVRLPPSAFVSGEPIISGYVLRSIEIPFKGEIRRLWIGGDYKTLWQRLRERVASDLILAALQKGDDKLLAEASQEKLSLQSVRLVINGWLQKRALKADEATFEQYMLQLVRISPTVTEGISGFSIRVVYKVEQPEPKPARRSRRKSKGAKRRPAKGRTKTAKAGKRKTVSSNRPIKKSARPSGRRKATAKTKPRPRVRNTRKGTKVRGNNPARSAKRKSKPKGGRKKKR